MATVNKNFRIKDGLIVEGTTGTINGYDIFTAANTTDDITEGENNLFFTAQRAADAVADEISLAVTSAVNALTTSDIEEGTNLYFTTQRAQDAGDGVFDAYGAASTAQSNAEGYTDTAIGNLSSVYDALGAASSAESNAKSYTDLLIGDGTVDGSSGNTVTDRIESAISGLAPNYITSVGTNLSVTEGELDLGANVVITDGTQSLSNKTFAGDVYFQSGGGAGADNNYISVDNSTGKLTVRSGYAADLSASGDINIVTDNGNIVLNADSTVYLDSAASGNEVVAAGQYQTLTNKTIDSAIVTGTTSFRDSNNVEGLTIDVSTIGTAHLIAADDLSLRATNDIVLYPGNDSYGHTGKAYIHWGNDATSSHPEREITTAGNTQVFTNKTFGDGGVLFNDGTVQYGHIYNDGSANLIIDGSQNDVILTSDSGHAYIGSNSSPASRIATQAYVDGVAQGLSVLGSVFLATSVNIADLSAPGSTIDSIGTEGIPDGSRILVKNQDAQTENGIYLWNSSTAGLVPSTNPEDADLKLGSYVFVAGGGTHSAQGWIVTSYTAGSSLWTQFSAAGEYTAGTGITLSGNAISVTANTYDAYGAADTAESNANDYTDTAISGLSSVYDASGAASSALTSANGYTDTAISGLSTVYDALGAASTAETNAKTYADDKFVTLDGLPGQLSDYVPVSEKGQALGVATLDEDGYVPASQLNIDVTGDISAAINALTTDDIEEGSTNLYYTDARAYDAVNGTSIGFTEVTIASVAKQVAATTSVATASTVTALSWAKADFVSAKLLVKAVNATESQVSEVLVTLDSSDNVAITEFGMIYTTDEIASISADVSGTDVRIRVTTAGASTDVTVFGTLLV